jgi:DNA polymerase-2
VRHRLRQDFSATFYAAGPTERLRALWSFLAKQPIPVRLAREQHKDLFQKLPLSVLAVRVAQAAAQPRLFQKVAQRYPELTYYNADLPITLRYAAAYGVFPLARCQIQADEEGQIQDIIALDSRWDLDPLTPPLRILHMTPNDEPFHTPPTQLHVRVKSFGFEQQPTSEIPHSFPSTRRYRLPLEPARSLLVSLRALLRRHDPDLLLSAWGDTWLLPYLLKLSRRHGISLPLNRDPRRGVAFRASRSYFSYGQVIYRGQQVHLFGRYHIDRYNAMLFSDYGLEGALEMARITTLPLQTAARVSPGSGISTMQMLTALRQGILVPWHKQQAERPKTALDLIHADQGGMVYQPLTGLHQDVAEIDFISMYPSIMVHFNISPETVGANSQNAQPIPQLNCDVDQTRRGLVPETLAPLLAKRITLKGRLAELPLWNPKRKAYKARSSAQKWLLVVCFGYLGYKNARFGRIEAHEAVTAYGREALLRAKEAAEDLGFTVLHMYVDGLWVCKSGSSTVTDYQPLLDAISTRTGLPISLDGIYRWVAFLPSRVDARLPVPNRYFGVFQDGSIKMRGIETRRRDTPPFIAQTQLAILHHLAQAPRADQLPVLLPQILAFLHRQLVQLRTRSIPLENLLVSQKISRELKEYRSPSPAARAAAQLEAAGKSVRPGQRVRFLYTLGEPGVHAWDIPSPPDPAAVDVARYSILLLRAAATALQPLGILEDVLRDWLFSNASYLAPPGVIPDNAPQLLETHYMSIPAGNVPQLIRQGVDDPRRGGQRQS